MDTFPEKEELLSGALKVDFELERVFFPADDLIEVDERDTEEVGPRD